MATKKETKPVRQVVKISELVEVKPKMAKEVVILYTLPNCAECENIRKFLNNTDELKSAELIEVNLKEARESKLPELMHTNAYIASPVVEHVVKNQLVGRSVDLAEFLTHIESYKAN